MKRFQSQGQGQRNKHEYVSLYAMHVYFYAQFECHSLFFCVFFLHFLVSMRNETGNSGRFPQEKSAATESHYPTVINYKVHAGSFYVSVIHRTLTWTTRSFTCIRGHSYACVYTPTTSQHDILIRKNSQFVLVFLTGFEPPIFGYRFRRSSNTPTHCAPDLSIKHRAQPISEPTDK